ncbi:MAG: polyprenyl synthetase family protein [Bacteroidales bacterium]|jgi:octaprenyl-diphosphate synthase
MEIKGINSNIDKDWQSFQKIMKENLESSSSLLNTINSYLLDNKGKQIRPLLSILSAKACGQSNDLSVTCSVVAEMIHTATLLHDDVADNASYRRGAPTVQTTFSPAASILTGDYWLAKALSLLVKKPNPEILGFFTKTVEDLSEGELFQMQKADSLDTTLEDYYNIIYRKTASLFVAAIKSAVYSVGAKEEILTSMERYAYHLGIAFQIRDDIFDYMPQLNTGKLAGGDIKEKKITLPLICALNLATSEERESLLVLMRETTDEERLVDEASTLIKKYHGIELAQKALLEHCKNAEDALSVLSESLYKSDLIKLARYVGNREV